ncbi:MAG: ATP-binding protein [Clostridiaceae bacterium]|nr:ATP-binding protein [Clostridiaceae bacterium]
MELRINRKAYLDQLTQWREKELIRRGYIVSIGKAGRSAEIDFVAVRDKNTEYFQVSASVLDETTLQREIHPFGQVEDHYPKYLLTLDEYESDHEGIRQKNLVTWLLEE